MPAAATTSTRLHERARGRGVNPVVYWVVRALLQPFFHLYFRFRRDGREHIPAEGPVIIAANHRSFLDPFVIGMMTRRPVYYVAKRELFANRRWDGSSARSGPFRSLAARPTRTCSPRPAPSSPAAGWC